MITYQPEKLKALLDSLEKQQVQINMRNWLTLPGGQNSSPFHELLETSTNRYKIKELKCGTQMCLAGHMANARYQELLEANEQGWRYPVWTTSAALQYVGIFDDSSEDYQEYHEYCRKFNKVFYRYRIRTINGLRKALKKEGLL